MDAAAIDKIELLVEHLVDNANRLTGGEAIYVPKTAGLEPAERYAETPRFHRHHYRTERLADFIAYARTAATAAAFGNPCAYVLPDGSGAMAVFDHGDGAMPNWGNHRATLALKPSSAWKSAQAMATGCKTQQQLIDWLEDWPEIIQAYLADGTEIEPRRAIAALRRVKIEASARIVNVEGDFSRQKSALESIEASGDAETLPAYFIAHTPLFFGTCALDIVLRLGVREQDGKPVLALRIVAAEQLADDTSQWVESELRTALGDTLAGVYVGALEIGRP